MNYEHHSFIHLIMNVAIECPFCARHCRKNSERNRPKPPPPGKSPSNEHLPVLSIVQQLCDWTTAAAGHLGTSHAHLNSYRLAQEGLL